MSAANNVNIMGRLTADPEIRQTAAGKNVCRFTVAVDRGRKNQNGERECDFISCIAWEHTAEFIGKYFSKGRMIAVNGEIRTGSYKDRNHPDVTHFTNDIVVGSAAFCGDKKADNQSGVNAPVNAGGGNSSSNGAVTFDLSDFEEVDGSILPF